MLEDLDNLSHRIAQLVALTQDARAQIAALQAEIGQRDLVIGERDATIRSLRNTIELAQLRVDDVLARLPGQLPESEAQDDTPEAAAHEGDVSAGSDDQPEPGDAESDARRAMHGTP